MCVENIDAELVVLARVSRDVDFLHGVSRKSSRHSDWIDWIRVAAGDLVAYAGRDEYPRIGVARSTRDVPAQELFPVAAQSLLPAFAMP